MTKKILDAWAVMAWLQGEEPARTRVSAVLDAASPRRVELSISMINVGEIFYCITKRRNLEAAEEFLADFAAFPVNILVPDRRQILEAARMRSRFPLSCADAFAMQAAHEMDAALITGDDEIRRAAGRAGIKLEWLAAH